jgi:hypothetical protein
MNAFEWTWVGIILSMFIIAIVHMKMRERRQKKAIANGTSLFE